MGLKQDIAKATNESEITSLTAKGVTYVQAEPKTRRQWARTAAARRNEFAKAAQSKTAKAKPKK